MKVIHTSLCYHGNGKSIYRASIVSARWTNKEKRRWSGRTLRDTGDWIVILDSEEMTREQICAACDSLSRSVAERLGMPAGPDTFPFRE
jgi:hypothetical protein